MRYRFLRTRLGCEMRWSRTEASSERGPSGHWWREWSNRSSKVVGHVNICGRATVIAPSGRLSSLFTKDGKYAMSRTHSDGESSLGWAGDSARAKINCRQLDYFLSHHACMKATIPHPKHMNRSRTFLHPTSNLLKQSISWLIQ